MEPKASLLGSLQAATGSYSQPVHILTQYIFTTYFSIMFHPQYVNKMPSSLDAYRLKLCNNRLMRARCTPSHRRWFDLSHNI
jgi:hypothetical protein